MDPDFSIDGFTAWAVELPMRTRFLSAASTMAARKLVIVRLESDGLAGWGEAAPVPGHGTEDLAKIWQRTETAGTHILGGAPLQVDGMAAAAISQAVVDLEAQAAGEPLWQHLGGSEPVWASAAIPLDAEGSPDRDSLDAAGAAGYRNAKLKITPTTRLAELKAIRGGYPGIAIGLDGNASLAEISADDFMAIDAMGFEYLEQPGPANDLSWHGRLRKALDTPLVLDEAAATPGSILDILAAEAADAINLKVGRFGTRETLDLAKSLAAKGIGVRLGGLIESGIGRGHSVALASCPVFSIVGDIAGSDRYFDNDLVVPSWRVDDGRIALPDAPGLGVAVDEDSITRLAFDSFHLG